MRVTWPKRTVKKSVDQSNLINFFQTVAGKYLIRPLFVAFRKWFKGQDPDFCWKHEQLGILAAVRKDGIEIEDENYDFGDVHRAQGQIF